MPQVQPGAASVHDTCVPMQSLAAWNGAYAAFSPDPFFSAAEWSTAIAAWSDSAFEAHVLLPHAFVVVAAILLALFVPPGAE